MLGICNSNPYARMSVVGECDKPNMLAFKRRGLPTGDSAVYDREVYNFFESRLHYGDDVIGMVKSFQYCHVNWAIKRVGKKHVKVCQMMRNPRVGFLLKWDSRVPWSARYFRKEHNRDPKNEREWFEAVLLRYTRRFYLKFLEKADVEPVVRLEDLNRSIGGDGRFFQNFMEWLTGTSWPMSYVEYIRKNFKPCWDYNVLVEWDKWPDGRDRVKRVITKPDTKIWKYRDNWDEDPEPKQLWEQNASSLGLYVGRKMSEWQKKTFLKFIGPYEKRLGYNQSYVGCVEREWECRKKYPWGEP